MQASDQHRSSMMSEKLYFRSVQEIDTFFPQFYTLDHQPYYCESGTGKHLNTYDFPEKYCTLESSSLANGSYSPYSAPSTMSFSSIRSPMSRQDSFSCSPDEWYSPDDTYGCSASGSCITDDTIDFKHKLRELETVMLGPESDGLANYKAPLYKELGAVSLADSWGQLLDAICRKDLKQVLIACAKAVSENYTLMAQDLMDQLRGMVSVSGEPIQRLGAYMLEGLVARLSSSGSCIYKALKCKEPESADLLSYMHILYEVCPYFKFGYMSANGAIAEAMKDEKEVHIIDFQIGQGSQWITLIQAFAARPCGPPRIRITGFDDSTSAYARGGGLGIVGKRLSKLAKSFKVPFEFNAAVISGDDIQLQHLDTRPGEALAVNFAFMLHRMPDESVSTQNHRDRLLRLVRGLSPKVVTLVEQESNTNTAAFLPRFRETLDYYTAMFESIDVTLPRERKERINVEQHCLARDLVNIIACEGTERVERHELLGKWKSRFKMAGFSPYPLSSLVNATIKTLLENYSHKYRLEERDGALYLGWKGRDLVASCAWQ